LQIKIIGKGIDLRVVKGHVQQRWGFSLRGDQRRNVWDLSKRILVPSMKEKGKFLLELGKVWGPLQNRQGSSPS